MRPLTAILAVLTGIAGWYYLFYSDAARRLEAIEQRYANQRRIIFRKINGLVLLVLAVLLYVGTYAIDDQLHPSSFAGVWLTIVVLLGVVVSLVCADIRLTLQLQGKRPAHRPTSRDHSGEAADRNPRSPP